MGILPRDSLREVGRSRRRSAGKRQVRPDRWRSWRFPSSPATARTRPRLAARDARSTSKGAATTRFLVKTAAAVVPRQASISARSRRPLALTPAATAEKAKPFGRSVEFKAAARRFIPPASPGSLQVQAGSRIWVTRRGPSPPRRSNAVWGIPSNPCEFYREGPRAGPG